LWIDCRQWCNHQWRKFVFDAHGSSGAPARDSSNGDEPSAQISKVPAIGVAAVLSITVRTVPRRSALATMRVEDELPSIDGYTIGDNLIHNKRRAPSLELTVVPRIGVERECALDGMVPRFITTFSRCQCCARSSSRSNGHSPRDGAVAASLPAFTCTEPVPSPEPVVLSTSKLAIRYCRAAGVCVGTGQN